MPDDRPDDAHLDGCDLQFTDDALEDDTEDLFVLFAEALDPASDVTVEDVEREWGVR